ncbi:MAG: hypothetical protein ACLGIZ_16775 [Acidimicrobiia bacterium]
MPRRADRSADPVHRPWTRVGSLAVGAHVFYELGAGVAMPLASRLGIGPAAVLYGTATAVSHREAGRRPASADAAFNALNGLYLGLVLGHAVSWPRRWAGAPWLTECEGLRGPVLTPYNVILQVSWVAAIGGITENRRGRWWAAVVPALVVPVLAREAPREFARLTEQARERPRWWNRRLQPAHRTGVSMRPVPAEG